MTVKKCYELPDASVSYRLLNFSEVFDRHAKRNQNPVGAGVYKLWGSNPLRGRGG